MHYLIQILLPLYDNDGRAQSRSLFDKVRDEMVKRHGGLTSYARTPVGGLWEAAPGKTLHDDLIIYEVMVDSLDTDWWADYRATLEQRFRQQSLLLRALPVTVL